MDNKIKILIISAAILAVGGIAAGIMTTGNKASQDDSGGKPELAVNEERFDLGAVSMADGLARRTVELKNTGTADLKISSIKTSCMCTEAVLEVAGKKSPKFGMHTSSTFWSETIPPGESARLEITYNPNAHGPDATGPVTRSVTLLSNDGGRNGAKTNIVFTADVVK